MQKKKFLGSLIAGAALMGFVAAPVIAAEIVVEAKEVYQKTVDNFLILYDSSSSMADKYAETTMTELEAAGKVLTQANNTLPNLDWNAGLYVFTPGKKVGLKESSFETVMPMAPYSKASFAKGIAGLPTTPDGATFLQSGLDEADKIINKLTGKTALFIFTDGTYTADKRYELKPLAMAKTLVRKYDTCIIVVSSATGATERGLIKDMGSLNECSMVIPFDQMFDHPGYATGVLYKVIDEIIEVAAEDGVFFDFNKSDIKPEYNSKLDVLGQMMVDDTKSRLVLAGYTDGVGSEGYNLELSKKRSEAVRDYLLGKFKIDKDRITLNWYGKADPIASNQTEEGRAANRRVVGILSLM
jgi:OOP family OmpA-OmpF porin